MDFINKSKALEQRLQGKLPGKQAQNILLAKARTPVMFPNSIEHAIPSAVLVLLYEKDNKIYALNVNDPGQELKYKTGEYELEVDEIGLNFAINNLGMVV